MTAPNTSLMTLGKALNKAGFSAKLSEASGSLQFDGMVLTLAADRRDAAAPMHVQIWEPQQFPNVTHKTLVQFVTVLPFRFDSAHVADIVRFVMLLNGIADFPGFGMEPADRTVSHRYTLISMDDDAVQVAAVIAAIQMIDSMVVRYIGLLEQVAIGAISLSDAFNRLRALHFPEPTSSSNAAPASSFPPRRGSRENAQ